MLHATVPYDFDCGHVPLAWAIKPCLWAGCEEPQRPGDGFCCQEHADLYISLALSTYLGEREARRTLLDVIVSDEV